MPRVTNMGEEGISLLRWRLLPKSHIFIDPQGRRVEDAPAYIAYSDQAKALADQGAIHIEGYIPDEQPSSETHASTEAPAHSDTVSPDRRSRKARQQER